MIYWILSCLVSWRKRIGRSAYIYSSSDFDFDLLVVSAFNSLEDVTATGSYEELPFSWSRLWMLLELNFAPPSVFQNQRHVANLVSLIPCVWLSYVLILLNVADDPIQISLVLCFCTSLNLPLPCSLYSQFPIFYAQILRSRPPRPASSPR